MQLVTGNTGVLAVDEELLEPTLNSLFALERQLLPGPDLAFLQDHTENKILASRKKETF